MSLTFKTLLRRSLFLSALLFPLSADAQVTLTGATWYATYTDGGTDINQAYALGFVNTVAGDQWWDLWLALNPNATLPANGPFDAQAGISFPLQPGNQYKYYFFSNCCDLSGDSGFSLFFNGSVNPGISVYGPLSRLVFVPDSASILSLQGNPIQAAGSSFYSSAGIMVVLSEFSANPPGTPPGNVCQAMSFTPASGSGRCAYGLVKIDVYPAAALSSSQTSGFPLSEVPLAGSGFEPGETVNITASRLGVHPFNSLVADGTGSFSTTVRLPQHAFGFVELFASGQVSHAVGATGLFVTSSVGAVPDSVAPGGAVIIRGLGFGSEELIDVYLDAPRQLLGSVAANAAGSFLGAEALQVTIPANATPGLNGLLGIGQTTNSIGIGKLIVE